MTDAEEDTLVVWLGTIVDRNLPITGQGEERTIFILSFNML